MLLPSLTNKTKLIQIITYCSRYFPILLFTLIIVVLYTVGLRLITLVGQSLPENEVITTTMVYPALPVTVLPPTMTASGVYIYDPISGETLYSRNPELRVPPASTTKLVTALVALEHYPLDAILISPGNLVDGSILKLPAGYRFTVRSLLQAMLISSNNDAAAMLADNIPDGNPHFIELMNAKASAIHLTNTRYSNAVGFDDPDQYTTVRDLALLSAVAIKNDFIRNTTAQSTLAITNVEATASYQLKSTNLLLAKIPGVIGLKTGLTENAGECLITLINITSRPFLIVLMGSADRFGETEKLITWLQTHLVWEEFTRTSYH